MEKLFSNGNAIILLIPEFRQPHTFDRLLLNVLGAFFIIQIMCVTTLAIKISADIEAKSVLIRNKKVSEEWYFENKVPLSHIRNDFSNVIFGGYTIIAVVLFLSRSFEKKGTQNITENWFLWTGVAIYSALGCYFAFFIENLLSDMEKSTLALTFVSFITALILFIDYKVSKLYIKGISTKSTQTDNQNCHYTSL